MLKRHVLALAVVVSTGAVAGMLAASGVSTAGETDPHQLVSDDPTGQVRTFNVNGALDLDNPFFKDLGTNGRTCFSCHRPAQGWTVTPESVQSRFVESRGLDPIFRTNDGSNCEGRRRVHRRQAPRRLQPAPHPRAHSHRHRRARGRRVRHRQRRRPVPLRCAVDRRIDVPAAVAVHEPALPERRHVGRPRVIAHDDDPAGPRQAGRRCDAGPRAGVAAPHPAGGAGDRGVRDRPVHRPGARRQCRLAARRRRDRRTGRAVATAVLHRHQRSGRSESDRRAIRSKRRSRSSTRGRMRDRDEFSRTAARHRPRPAGLQHEADRDLRASPASTTRRSRTASRCRSRSPARARRVTTRRTRATTR